MGQSKIITTHQSTWRSRSEQGGHRFTQLSRHIPVTPFLMRAGGVIVNDISKIHFNDPTSSDDCISFERNDLKIAMKFSGTFSYVYS